MFFLKIQSGTLRTKKGALYSIFHMAVRVKTFCGRSEFPSSWEDFYTGLLSYLFSLLINSKESLFPTTILLKQPKDKFNSNLNNTNSNRSSTTSWGRNFTSYYPKCPPSLPLWETGFLLHYVDFFLVYRIRYFSPYTFKRGGDTDQ